MAGDQDRTLTRDPAGDLSKSLVTRLQTWREAAGKQGCLTGGWRPTGKLVESQKQENTVNQVIYWESGADVWVTNKEPATHFDQVTNWEPATRVDCFTKLESATSV